MALNQNAHKRNLEAFEKIKQLRANQKKYNITPETVIKGANELNEYANMAGNSLNKLGETTNNTKLQEVGKKIADNTGSNLKSKMYDFAKDKITTLANKVSAAKNAASTASDVAKTASTAAKTASNVANVANNASKVANAANTASNVANAANTASTAANAANTASNVANTASNVSSAASGLSSAASAAPVVGTALGALSAGNNFAKGNYTDGALDLAATGAMFIPGVGWAVSGAIKLAQALKGAYEKKKMKAHQKTQAEAARATEESVMNANEAKQKIADRRTELQQQMASENPINGQLGDGGLKQMGMPSMQDITNEFKKEPVGNFAEKGNIDLFNRPVTQNEDGTISTVRSMSFNDGNHEVLIPTVADDGAILSEEDAINNYYKTGKHLGKFNSVEDANQYAENLHNQQEGLYGGVTGGAASISDFDMFEDPTVFKDYNQLARDQAHQENAAPFKNLKYKLKSALRGDTTSDMNGSVAYDYRSPATQEKQNRDVADMINKELAKVKQPQAVQQPVVQGNSQSPIKIGQDVKFTPEQQARYNEIQAIQAQGQQVPTLEGSTPTEPLPKLPNAQPTQVPSKTNFNPAQFEYINPDGTTVPAGQQTQQPTVQGQVSTTQPAQLVDPTQTQQQAMPYDEKAGRVANIMQRIRQGYGENTTESFDPANMADKTFTGAVKDANGNVVNKEINKDIWNRLGEGIGTGQKLLSNPLMQGLIAGAIYKATGGDGGESLKYGVDWAQNKAKSDYYQKQINPNAKPNILGGYTADDWKTKESIENAKAQQQYSQAILEERRKENDIRIQKILSDIQKQNAKQGKSDDGFVETFTAITKSGLPEETVKQKLALLLRDYAVIDDKKAKNLAELYGIDLGIGNK